MVLLSILRAWAIWFFLSVVVRGLVPTALTWRPLLAISLLIVASHSLLLDLTSAALPPLGKAIESFIATLSVLTLTLHRLIPSMAMHPLLLLTLVVALAMGGFEWAIEGHAHFTPIK